MKIHRFLINKKIENLNECVITNPSLSHQLNNVLRLKVGEQVILLDGLGGEFLAKIKCFTKDTVEFFDVNENTDKRKLPGVNMYLASAVIKKDKFEWVVQKGTEIGVMNFIPVISERTEKSNLNIERLEKIIFEAFEQSEKSVVPKIFEVQELASVVENFPNMKKFYMEIDAPKINLGEVKGLSEVLIFVGPEGGWGESDRKFFQEKNVQPISVGDVVLRAETASIAISSLVLLG